MKVLPFKIPKPSNVSLFFQIDKDRYYEKLHEHEEVQISYILKGAGTILAGDGVHHYKEGDLLILGSGLPHLFKDDTTDPCMHSIFFSRRAFGEAFMSLEESQAINHFYTDAKAGFKAEATARIITLFKDIPRQQSLSRLILFLQLIQEIQPLEHLPLSTFSYKKHITEADGQKLKAIFDYTLTSFTKPITLKAVADVAAMSPNAFCKYFKKRTNKTYFQYVTELRIAKASKLLLDAPEYPITGIAEISGFQTISHFNRKFKTLKGMSPREWRS